MNNFFWVDEIQAKLQYYPLSVYEVSDSDKEIRKLIWNFKASPKIVEDLSETIVKRNKSIDIIIPKLYNMLIYYFGKDQLSKLVLLCLPASSKKATDLRYKYFSERLCKVTGMINGFPYVFVDSDGEAKHLGGEKKAKYSFDKDFFKDKEIILFDDVITSGKSMEDWRQVLELFGGKAVGGISIGLTKHSKLYEHNNPIEVYEREERWNSPSENYKAILL